MFLIKIFTLKKCFICQWLAVLNLWRKIKCKPLAVTPMRKKKLWNRLCQTSKIEVSASGTTLQVLNPIQCCGLGKVHSMFHSFGIGEMSTKLACELITESTAPGWPPDRELCCISHQELWSRKQGLDSQWTVVQQV